MIQKAYLAFIGVVIVATIAAAGVVAACYALFALLSGPLGQAGAAGVLAAAIFMLIGLSALFISLGTKRAIRARADRDLSAKLIQLARDKPLVAVGALVAAGIVVAANPKSLPRRSAPSSLAATRANPEFLIEPIGEAWVRTASVR